MRKLIWFRENKKFISESSSSSLLNSWKTFIREHLISFLSVSNRENDVNTPTAIS